MKPLEIGNVEDSIAKADSEAFDPEIYRETGFFVVRNVIPREKIEIWQNEWSRFYQEKLESGRLVNKFNPVRVHEDTPQGLSDVHECPEILDVLQKLYPDLALFKQRIVIKDKNSRKPVFPHNDFCYDYGWPEKTTVFIPLSVSNEENGGISFYPGTHHFGYMGDAGEVNLDMISAEWPLICPSLNPGDIALCHTCTWHCSPEHVGGPDRILVQVTFQPADDPSSIKLLRGNWRTRYRLSDLPREKFFVRSRSSRLRELQAQIDRIESDAV